jgi:hypothetical protein
MMWLWPVSQRTIPRRYARADRHRSALAAALPVIVGLTLLICTSCRTSTPASDSGDPGGRHLRQLRADPVFSSLPPGSTMVGRITEHTASYRKPGLDGGGWSGPAVTLKFTSDRAPASVYDFYGVVAQANGWTVTAKGARNLADTWTKTYAGASPASLSLTEASGPTGLLLYTLNASSPPVDQ